MRLLSMITAALLIASVSANSQDKPLPVDTVRNVARSALPTLSQLVTAENLEAMGFASLEDVKKVALDDSEPPLQVFMVRLDQLKEYEPGTDPTGIFSGGEMAYYPVTVGGKVRVAVGVERIEEKWQASSFGDASLIQMLTAIRRQSSDSTKVPARSYSVVKVPALNLHFLAYRTDTDLMLVPVQDDAQYKFKAGVAMPAGRAFENILPAAQAHDGSPR
ncbi:MAG: hypothetical protein JSW34_10380 [Candidatus Zixiibacteriota bacterium]|nr:MAG: hypothetical protein JSW34_10380 [candidate division Zixibacteria bacterium]